MLVRFWAMDRARVDELEGESEDREEDPTTAAYELLALVEAIHGIEKLLFSPPPCSVTAREELWAASEIVGWVLEVLPPDSESNPELRDVQATLLRGQAALAAAAEHPAADPPWDEVRTTLTSTRRLLTVTAASLVPSPLP